MSDAENVVRIGSLELRFLVDEDRSAGNLVSFEFTVPENARVPVAHFHRDVDEFVYGLEGTMGGKVGDAELRLKPGDSVYVPRGVVHYFENLGPGTAKALVVLSPGSIGKRYFEEMAEAINGPIKPDPALLKDIMNRHGLIPS